VKAPGFKPLPLNINPGFKVVFPFKFNLRHYSVENLILSFSPVVGLYNLNPDDP
jgi:hypothetical protein